MKILPAIPVAQSRSIGYRLLAIGYSASTTPLHRQPYSRSTRLDPRSAFTLLEVIIACAIFFMVAFAILGVVTQGLAAARAMQIKEPDAGVVAAMISTNKQMIEGTLSGDFDDFFPDLYPGYTWQADMFEISSNSLFQVDITVFSDNRKRGPSESKMSLLMFVPGSPPGSASKAR